MSCVALKDYPKATFSGFVKRLRPTQTNITYDKYIGFYLRSKFFRKTMTNNAIMTLRASLNEEIFSYLKLYLPDFDTQKKNGDLLFLLNSKIELNNCINTELEAMAKKLYDYWFVQFDFPDKNGKPYKSSGGKMVWNEELKREIPQGWEVKTLIELGDIVGGSTPSTNESSFFSSDGFPWITPKDLSLNTNKKFISRGEICVTEAGIRAASLQIFPKGSVLLTSRAPVGYTAISLNEVTTNQGFKSFIPKNGYTSAYIYYTINLIMKTIIGNASGSTFKEISGGTLKSIKFYFAPTEIVKLFTCKIEAAFNRQEVLIKENETLSSLRDFLLPMLMNGQVKVKT
jgi:type I restriction enzyme, S subunit